MTVSIRALLLVSPWVGSNSRAKIKTHTPCNQKPAGKTSLQIWNDGELHLKFKMPCSLKKVKMSDVAGEMIKEWVEQAEKDILWLSNIKK